MSSYPRSQDSYIRTGEPGQYRVRGDDDGGWYVEGTDANGVWVSAEPGTPHYATRGDAQDAADEMAAQ